MKTARTYATILSAFAVVLAVGTWGYSTSRGNGVSAQREPYRVEMDCMRYSRQTGRATMRIVIQNITQRPIRFRGHVLVTIRHDLPTAADGRPRWHPYATARARTPLVTIGPEATYEWSRRSRPILLHGSTKRLSSGSCEFYANPPRFSG